MSNRLPAKKAQDLLRAVVPNKCVMLDKILVACCWHVHYTGTSNRCFKTHLYEGLTKRWPPSMFGDGLSKGKFLGVLNIFVPTLQIPTYLGSRGMLPFSQFFFKNMLAMISKNVFSEF